MTTKTPRRDAGVLPFRGEEGDGGIKKKRKEPVEKRRRH
jgi:hypothetical protein